MKFQAHRGVSTEAPENTMPSVELAVAQGYQVIEVDVDVTRDMQYVLLHDHSLGRTARDANGKALQNAPDISDITYEEMQSYDFGLWFSQKYRGVKAPLLREVLDYARQNGVQVKIDNKYRFFTPEGRRGLYELLSQYQDIAQLTCFTLEDLAEAVEYLPEMDFHYDGPISEENLEQIAKMLPADRVTAWIPIKNRLTTWVKIAFADQTLADMIRKYAKLGVWIISSYEDADFANSLGADIVETNGLIKPTAKAGIVADMHTHSEHSHDSVCPVDEMAEAQIKKGTNMMALTDHFDTHSYGVYDIHTPIANGHKDVDRINGEKKGIRLLKGIELGEAFWSDEAYDRIRGLEYDVIIGSVHVIRYGEGYEVYSGTDFASLSEEDIYGLLDAYFDDMLTMLDKIDFDILAHLTCPLRYIEGKYNIKVDISRFEEKINKILGLVIRTGKALEVNTSGYGINGELLPDRRFLQKYYDMGGYLVTLGSDAHVSKNASAYFDEAVKVLKEIGFKHLYYFENRRPIPYEI